MSKRTLPHKGMNNKRLKYTLFGILCIALIPAISLLVQSQEKGNIKIDDEFPTSFSEAKQQYHNTINCYFNMATANRITTLNEEYKKEAGESKNEILKMPKDTKCDNLGKIGKQYATELTNLLQSISTNVKNISEEEIEKELQDTTIPNTCNLDLTSKETVLLGTPPIDYFKREQQFIKSPTYAVAVVSNCYLFVYEQYLNNLVYTSFQAKEAAKEEGQQSVTVDTVLQKSSNTSQEAQEELTRSEKIIDLALAGFEEFSQTLPLHIRYEQIIYHSQLLRDQMKRFRIATDQLQYKLINQSTKSCD